MATKKKAWYTVEQVKRKEFTFKLGYHTFSKQLKII